MAAVRSVWLALAVCAFAAGLGIGVPLWASAAAFVLAAIPAIAGMFMRNFVEETSSDEIETTLWVGLTTFAMALTGGPTSGLTAGFAIVFLLAASTRRRRLVLESVGFSMLGYIAVLLVGLAGDVIDPTVSEKLASVYGLAAVVLIARLVWLNIVPTGHTPGAAPTIANTAADSAAAPDFDLVKQLRLMEVRLARSSAAVMEAREKAAKAETALEARTRFFAQTSHELRQPLNAINGFSQMISAAMFGPIAPKYREYADDIQEAGRHLGLVVDDVLDLSKIEAGHQIVRENCSLSDLLERAVHFMQFEAERKKVALTFEDEEDIEAFIDPKAVHQIALNLISNALKFTPAGGHVIVKTFESNGVSWLAVSDTGVGMSVEELSRMSRAFEQGAAGREQKGSGLGLSVVRAFAELHDGGLEIESREGGGTTVAVYFPTMKPESGSPTG